jgi:uncharacterized OsmC-like protein
MSGPLAGSGGLHGLSLKLLALRRARLFPPFTLIFDLSRRRDVRLVRMGGPLPGGSMTTELISSAISEARRHLEQNPQHATGEDGAVHARLRGGLVVEASDDDDHAVVTDMPPSVGGGGSGFKPGGLLRAALASCDATLLAMEAAARDIELSRLEVVVESSSDHRGMLGFDGAPPGPLEFRLGFRLSSPDASEEQLRSLVEYVEAHSPVGQALRAVPSEITVEIS